MLQELLFESIVQQIIRDFTDDFGETIKSTSWEIIETARVMDECVDVYFADRQKNEIIAILTFVNVPFIHAVFIDYKTNADTLQTLKTKALLHCVVGTKQGIAEYIEKAGKHKRHNSQVSINVEIETEASKSRSVQRWKELFNTFQCDERLAGEATEYVIKMIQLDEMSRYLRRMNTIYDSCIFELIEGCCEECTGNELPTEENHGQK